VTAASAHGARVVVLDHCAQPSGGQLALLRTLPHLRDVASHVILFEDGPMVDRYRGAGIPVEVLPLDPAVAARPRDARVLSAGSAAAVGRSAAFTARLARRLRTLQPDIVHANSLKAIVVGIPAARAARRPLVAHVRDRLAADYLPASQAWAMRGLVRAGARGVVANSAATLATVGRLRVPHAVIPSPGAPVAPVASSAARRGPLTFAMVGRISPWKGQDVFLRAFARAFPDGSERARIVGAPLFGESAYQHELERLVAELGLAERVHFTGHRDDVVAEYGRADVLVHASTLPEPFGQVIVEGLAAGLPVLASDAGGPREILTHGETGLLHRPGDAVELAAHLRLVADDAALRARLRVAGLQVAERYDPARLAEELEALYGAVLGGAVEARPVHRLPRTAPR